MSSEDAKSNADDRDMSSEDSPTKKDDHNKSSDAEEKEKVKAENDTKAASSATDDGSDGEGDTEEEVTKKPAKKRGAKANVEVKEEEEKETEEDEDDGDEADDDDEKKNGIPAKGRKAKDEEKRGKNAEIEIPNGKGTAFSRCPRIEHFIKTREADQLKKLHIICFGRAGKPDDIKGNLLQFKGFDYEPESDAFTKKKQAITKLDFKHLKDACEVLDVEKKGKKEDIVTRLMEFLMNPKDSGKAVPVAPAPRPKRTSAVKANNRGYAGLDAEDSDDEEGGGRRGGARGAAGRRAKARPSYKDESSSEEEKKAKKGGRNYSESDVESDPEVTPSEDEDSDSPKKKKVAPAKPKGRGAPKKRAAPAAKAAKKTPAKKGKKKASEDSDDGPSESEDEPLQKKSKKFPSDDEIKKYVKQILDGANLEEITMKTVCKQVYGRYPDHDLTHKKDLIKSTVKSLIAT